MAKIDNLFDSGRGKLGNLIFYKVGEKNYVRTRAEHFHDRKSPAQLAQRQRLQVMNRFLSPFRELFPITFAGEAAGGMAMQAAQSYNMRNALAGEYPDIYVDKSRALLSRGPLPVPAKAWMETHPDGLFIQWENGEEAVGKSADDILLVMAAFPDQKNCLYLFSETRRSAGSYKWKISVPEKENELPDVWIAFSNGLRTKLSNSRYVLPG